MNRKALLRTILGNSEKSDDGLKILLKFEDEENRHILEEIKTILLQRADGDLECLSAQNDSIAKRICEIDRNLGLLESNDKILVEQICNIRDSIEKSLDEDFISKKMKPMLIEIADFVTRLFDSLNHVSNDIDSNFVKRVSIILESFLEVLENNIGATLIMPKNGDSFCDESFVVVRGEDTDNPEFDRRVAEVCKAGIIFNDQILRAAEVAGERYKKRENDLNEKQKNG
jgi:molecular chaperone GrpE (heat shock protein)